MGATVRPLCSNREPILLVGNFVRSTGGGRVLQAIAAQLSPHYRVHILAIDIAQDQSTDDCCGQWTVHPNPFTWDWLAESTLVRLAQELLPGFILLYHCPLFILRWLQALEGCAVPTIAYCMLEGELRGSDTLLNLGKLDRIVMPTEFARNALKRAAATAGLADQAPFNRIEVIPHGIDLDEFGCKGAHFKPFPARRQAARRALFPESPAMWEGFWVFNGNSNTTRKRLDITLQGFAQFARNKPGDVRLFMQTSMDCGDYDLRRMAINFGIENRLIQMATTVLSAEQRNLVYNACDVGVNTALGEGWGLVSVEHGATGAAQVVPGHTACAEIWSGAAEILPIRETAAVGDLFTGGAVGAEDLAAALERLYTNTEHYNALACSAYRVAHRKEYRWDRVGELWQLQLRLT